MLQVINIIDQLRELSGNEQTEYLYEYHNNLLLKEVLLYTYDTNKKYKIDEARFDKSEMSSTYSMNLSISSWNKFRDMLDILSSQKGVSDEDVDKVKYFITSFAEPYSLFLKQVLFKDLRINMGIKKMQKVWDDFCFTYPYMGAKPYSEKNLSKITFPCYVQTKMDGLFCNLIVDFDNKTIDYISRQGKPMNIQGSLDTILKTCDDLTGKYVFNGEILVYDKSTDRPYPREISNGIIRRDNKTEEELNSIRFICWDYIPWNNFLEHKWDKRYDDRELDLFFYEQSFKTPRFKRVHTEIANNLDEVYRIYNEQYSNGEEGVVVKNRDQIWKDGKPSGQVKIKAEKDCDLRMVEFIEGKGAYKNMCGSIKCMSQDNKVEVYVKPRNPQIAQTIWGNRDLYLNQILAVKYNALIKSPNKDTYSLYLPVFIEIRDDKQRADYLEHIS